MNQKTYVYGLQSSFGPICPYFLIQKKNLILLDQYLEMFWHGHWKSNLDSTGQFNHRRRVLGFEKRKKIQERKVVLVVYFLFPFLRTIFYPSLLLVRRHYSHGQPCSSKLLNWFGLNRQFLSVHSNSKSADGFWKQTILHS